ncbi:hypothetical protein P3T76_001027 [Phytophthora citrophthora]|uniref:Uncharacterized protein n=1 Tax=Phytophthora citrophthora TaxID=4793 RepID=A0AAD9LU37_9STRA|nr:hypothetical protein P3T76_001027 [Phytophthora citrophthora]
MALFKLKCVQLASSLSNMEYVAGENIRYTFTKSELRYRTPVTSHVAYKFLDFQLVGSDARPT